MDSQPRTQATDDFFSVAVRERMLSADLARQLSGAARAADVTPGALCIERGALKPVQTEVIHALLAPDSVAPGYEVTGLLGYGGLGVVYRARQPQLDRTVALKTIQLNRIDNPTTVARFQQEAKLIGKLHHPNIVAAYDFGTHGGRLFLAMELVDGTDLDETIKAHGPLGEGVAWALARQVAAGLAHAAELGVVHRDIKPANLLLTDPPAGYPLPAGVPLLKITDFGLAQLAAEGDDGTRLTMAGSSMGTPHYMAPEQIADAHVDQRADIYALGATVYHMLTGAAPYADKKTGQVLSAKLRDDPALLANLETSVTSQSRELLKRLLAHDPDKRLSSYERLLTQLDTTSDSARATPAGLQDGDADTVPSLVAAGEDISLSLETMGGQRGPTRRALAVLVLSFGAMFAIALTAVTTALRTGSSAGELPGPRFVRSDWEVHLFRGQTLELGPHAWTRQRGEWRPTNDAEDALVLAGKGSIVRMLPTDNAPDGRAENYGVRLNAALPGDSVLQLHFDHADHSDAQAPRAVLEYSRQGIRLGYSDTLDGPFKPEAAPLPYPERDAGFDGPMYDQLRIERHGTYWLALANNEIVGHLPILGPAERPAIQLHISGDAVHLEGLALYELRPALE